MTVLAESAGGSGPSQWRENAFAALAGGRSDEAHAWLRRALAETVDLEGINDLAVLAHQLGRADEAEWLLRAVLAIEPAREDAVNNLTALAQVEGHVGWRRSRTLGGPDPAYCERAFPGMPRPDIISEHCSRYSFALSLIGGLHVLDLGCGTGYGSEMLSWSAASVRGFDLWQPGANEHPRWPGVLELNYGHDLCLDPLPHAEAAVMFEVIEHLPDAPQALEIAWSAVGTIIASFPNPVYHGSFMNRYHVNDWSLDRFERELERAALAAGRDGVSLTHYHQPLQSPLLVAGRDPDSSYWIVVARATDDPHTNTPGGASELAPCPICGSDQFATYAGRPNAVCVDCGALERHRALVRINEASFENGDGRAVLEIGPLNGLVFGEYLRERGWKYISTDASRRGNPLDPRDVDTIDYEIDACELSPIKDDSVQLVIVQHVIEEIPDYKQALAEIRRVLAPDGTALLEIPFDPERKQSLQQDPDRYGNVWSFGRDLLEVLRRLFGDVEVQKHDVGPAHGRILSCGSARRGLEKPASGGTRQVGE
jgi:SAM-dependent methyltransferase